MKRTLALILNCVSSIALIVTLFQMSESLIEVPPTYGNHVHKTILLDRNFDEDEVEFITIAAMEWTEATHHVAEFDVVQLPAVGEQLGKDTILMASVGLDDPDILIHETETHHADLGLQTTRNGIAVIKLVSERIPNKYYKEVVLHELGHALGLEHNEGLDGIDTLMYPFIELSAPQITPIDLDNFCKLYHCNSKH